MEWLVANVHNTYVCSQYLYNNPGKSIGMYKANHIKMVEVEEAQTILWLPYNDGVTYGWWSHISSFSTLNS